MKDPKLAFLTLMNQTGHVQGLRIRLRELPAQRAVDAERMLDCVLEWAFEYAQPKPKEA